MWVQDSELSSSARAVYGLYSWAISPALLLWLEMLNKKTQIPGEWILWSRPDI